jgi:dTDP-4-amino-4,6-dideoxygalactose transaminase
MTPDQIKIPLLIPEMPTTDELLPWLKKIDTNKIYTNFGPLNCALEKSITEILSKKIQVYVTTVANCTVGLEIGLRAFNLRKNANVLAPALTFAATGTSIVNCGYNPMFCDIDLHKWVLTPEIAYEYIKKFRIDAIIPVSTFGLGLDTSKWDSFTRDTGIPVLIDSASAFGNQEIGNLTKVVFSLHSTKSLGSGEGGFIASADKIYNLKIKTLSNFGIESIDYDGYIDQAGTNAKMSEYHAAVALASLKRWSEIKKINQINFNYYINKLKENEIFFIAQEGGEYRNHTLLPLRIKSNIHVKELVSRLAKEGIQSRRWYSPLLNEYNCFKSISQENNTVNAKEINNELIGLPFFPSIRNEQIDIVVEKLKAIISYR